ncbi:Uncharacterized protein SCF082_LOCUS12065, partial [Durusdinium trenchii]
MFFVHVPRCGGTSLTKLFKLPSKTRKGRGLWHKIGLTYFFYRYRVLETRNFPLVTYENLVVAIQFALAMMLWFFGWMDSANPDCVSDSFWGCPPPIPSLVMMCSGMLLFISSTFLFTAPLSARNDFLRRAYIIFVGHIIFNWTESEDWLTGVSKKGYVVHFTAAKMIKHELLSREDFQRVDNFAIVRNPYSRMVSVYMYNRFGSLEGFDHFVEVWYKKFLRYKEKNCTEEWDVYCHVLPQYEFTHENGSQLVRCVIKQENLRAIVNGSKNECFVDAQVSTLPQKVLQALRDMPHSNRRSKNKPWQDFYSKRTMQLVHEMYREDFEIFGYDEDIPGRPDLDGVISRDTQGSICSLASSGSDNHNTDNDPASFSAPNEQPDVESVSSASGDRTGQRANAKMKISVNRPLRPQPPALAASAAAAASADKVRMWRAATLTGGHLQRLPSSGEGEQPHAPRGRADATGVRDGSFSTLEGRHQRAEPRTEAAEPEQTDSHTKHRKRSRRMPKYLREDLPKLSMIQAKIRAEHGGLGKASLLLEEVARELGDESVSSCKSKNNLKGKRKKKKRRPGKNKERSKTRNRSDNHDSTETPHKVRSDLLSGRLFMPLDPDEARARYPTANSEREMDNDTIPASLAHLLQHSVGPTMRQNSKRRSNNNDEPQNASEEGDGNPLNPSNKDFVVPLLQTTSNSRAFKRLNERLMSMQVPGARRDFFEEVDTQQVRVCQSNRAFRRALREQGRDALRTNKEAVQKPAEAYLSEIAKRRAAMFKQLQQALDAANERRHEIEAARMERIAHLCKRDESKAATRAASKWDRLCASKLLQIVVLACHGAELDAVYHSLHLRKVFRAKAVIIQRTVRAHLRQKKIRDALAAKLRVTQFFRVFVVARKKRRRSWAAKTMLQFLQDCRLNVSKVMRDFRFRVIRCQRYVRDYIACTQARLLALNKMWGRQEKRLAERARALRVRQLEQHSMKLEQQASEMTKSNYHKQLASKWLRGVKVSPVVNDQVSLTRTGKLYFPVHIRDRSRMKAASPTGLEQTPEPGDQVTARHAQQANENAQFVMDLFLNEEYRAKLLHERSKPVHLPPTPRNVRTRALRSILDQARAKARAARSLRLTNVDELESKKIKITIKGARNLLRELDDAASEQRAPTDAAQTSTHAGPVAQGVQNVTLSMFSDLAAATVLQLFSQIDKQDLFRMVQQTQISMTRSKSVRELLAQVVPL